MSETQNKAFLNHSVFIFLYRLFPSLATVGVLIYFSHLLPRDVYGSYQLFWVQFNLLSAFACAGVHVLILTYSSATLLHLYKKISRKTIVSLSGWMLLVTVVFGFMNFKTDVPYYTGASLLLVLSLNAIAEATLVTLKKFGSLTTANFLYSFLFCLLHVAFIKYHWQFSFLFLMILVIAGSRLISYAVIIVSELKKTPDAEIQTIHLKRVRTQWLHLALYDVIQISYRWIDKIVIGFLLSKDLFALYFNGSIDIPFLSLVLGATSSAVLINLADVKTFSNRKEKSLQLMLQSARILSCMVFPLFFFLVFFRYELISVLLSDKYIAAVPIFLMSILSVPVRAYSFTTLLQHYHKGHIINIGASADLILSCLLLYPMYKLMGLAGVAFSFTITTYLQAAYYLYHSAKILQKPVYTMLPVRNWSVKFVACLGIFWGLHHLLGQHFTQQIILILGSISLAVIIAAILFAELKTGRKNVDATQETAI